MMDILGFGIIAVLLGLSVYFGVSVGKEIYQRVKQSKNDKNEK